MSRSSARGTSRSPRKPSVPPPLSAASPCPCGLPAPYGECCGRFHSGSAAAPTAELLMRSRYSAFVAQDAAYLMRSWHPDTRPATLDLDPDTRWQGLDILATTDGSAFHTTGTVTFRAHYAHRGESGSLHEQSRFARHEGAWVYLDAVFTR
ncbi:YchJ family protein [Streptomyces chryseus]|uniref:YchJ family protein n=1 Tax=Streptomyces chryseus TaxID=68186 RepID=UPI00110F8520|nr:YchJ family metal-binding protein [Streptomyces chryseus]